MCGALAQHVRRLCTFVEEGCEPYYWHPLYIKTMMTLYKYNGDFLWRLWWPTLSKKPIIVIANTSHVAYHHHLTSITYHPSDHHHLTSNTITHHPTIFLLLSTHKPQRLRGRDGGRLVHNHRQKKPYVTDGRGGEGSGVVQLSVYQETHNQGNPSGRYRRMPSDKICRKMRYELQVVSLQS